MPGEADGLFHGRPQRSQMSEVASEAASLSQRDLCRTSTLGTLDTGGPDTKDAANTTILKTVQTLLFCRRQANTGKALKAVCVFLPNAGKAQQYWREPSL